ncbi:MAG: hypothetical protein KatS3mg054_1377 [Chloroflexus sp.]|nr:MAG: hypothetical protein KatS3mg054_1377 [Chloroflexus sp.]
MVYLDPPSMGRHADYYQQWSEDDVADVARIARNMQCGFALSMWKENQYRLNQHITPDWDGLGERTFTHFYHIGSTENLRNAMEEALLIKLGYETVLIETTTSDTPIQLALAFDEQAGY